MRTLLYAIILLTLLPALSAAPIVETTGTINLTNNNGQISAGVGAAGGNGISVTFLNEQVASSNGGGNGGGDAVQESPCLLPPIKTSHSYDNLVAGREYAIKAPNNQFIIQKILFTLTKSYEEGATFILTHVRKIECETIPPVPSDRMALDYERVDYVGIDPSVVEAGVTITFQLTKKHLDELEAATNEVTLFRYDGNNWKPLPTALLSETSSIATFKATAPGLSHFAITLPAPENTVVDSGQGELITGEVVTGNGEETDSGIDDSATDSGDATGETTTIENTTNKRRGGVPIWSFIVLILIGGALGAYYYYDNKKKVSAINKKAEERHTKKKVQLGFADIGDKAFEGVQDPVEQLHDYVDEELREGFTRDEILAELRKSGWPDNIITQVLDDFRKSYLAKKGMGQPHSDYEHVSQFLKEKLDLGYDVAVIKKSLAKAGWNETLIEKMLADIQGEGAAATAVYSNEALEKLRSFISSEQKKGFSKEQIRGALLKAGWQEGVIDKELK